MSELDELLPTREEWDNLCTWLDENCPEIPMMDCRIYSGGMAVACAEEFLLTILANGACSQNIVRELAESDGHTWATIRRAKKNLGVASRKTAFAGGWEWYFPA